MVHTLQIESARACITFVLGLWHGQPDAEAHHIYRVVGNIPDRFLGIGWTVSGDFLCNTFICGIFAQNF